MINIILQKIDILRRIKQFYNEIKIGADVMFLNNIPFVTSISNHIHYGIANTIDNLKYPALEG